MSKHKTEAEWKQVLSPEQFVVCRQKGTERAFTGQYYDCTEEGIYRCVCCGSELFSSEMKYNSNSGWASFWGPSNENAIKTEVDNRLNMQRIEAMCNECDSHLGHIFEDGSQPTGLRYCINSVSLKLDSKES